MIITDAICSTSVRLDRYTAEFCNNKLKVRRFRSRASEGIYTFVMSGILKVFRFSQRCRVRLL